MLRSLNELERYKVNATDGDIGSVADFLLEDDRWTVRYLVVETGGFFSERRVLITPISFRQVDWSTKHFHLALTIERVKSSLSVDMDMPVSRQKERDYYRHYGYPYYWENEGLWGMGAYPGMLAKGGRDDSSVGNSGDTGDIHLRSVNEVRGYKIQGTDEEVGHVDDFIVDDESWEVCYLVVDTGHWWFGKKVLIAPRWATHVSWEERQVQIDLNRQQIQDSPEWNPTVAINREYETRLHKHYERPAYWNEGRRQVQEPASQHQPG